MRWTKQKALAAIRKAYPRTIEGIRKGVLPDLWAVAAEKRVGSKHVETPRGGESYCAVCGLVEAPTADPVFHPEQYVDVRGRLLSRSCRQCRIRPVADRGEYPDYAKAGLCEKCGADRTIEEDARARRPRKVKLWVKVEVEVDDPAWTDETLIANTPDYFEVMILEAERECAAKYDGTGRQKPYRIIGDVTVFTSETLAADIRDRFLRKMR